MADADLYDDSDPFGDGAGGGLGAEPEPAPGVNPMFDGKVIQEVKGYLQKKSPNRYRLNRWQKRWFVMDGITLSWWERSEHEAEWKGFLAHYLRAGPHTVLSFIFIGVLQQGIAHHLALRLGRRDAKQAIHGTPNSPGHPRKLCDGLDGFRATPPTLQPCDGL